MGDYRTNMTGVAALDDSIFTEMDQAFIIAAHTNGIMDQFVSFKRNFKAVAIEFPKYSLLADATTALTAKEDVDSVAMSDAQIILTPQEYGNVVTKTQFLSSQSGGKSDLAVAEIVGINMQRTLNKLAILAGEAGSNIIYPGSVTAEDDLIATSIMTTSFLNRLYNKLSKAGVMPLSDGLYVAILHPDQVHDLRNSTGTGSWQDISKYTDGASVLRGEIGQLAGFKIIVDSQVSANADSGSGTVDSYHCLTLGFNALGKAVSYDPELVVKPAGDSLNRFTNVGWKATLTYKIVDSDAIWVGTTASSVGAN